MASRSTESIAAAPRTAAAAEPVRAGSAVTSSPAAFSPRIMPIPSSPPAKCESCISSGAPL
eukprot:scaffold117_cov99-Isochrysis_galbana.AAC.2